MASGLGSGRSIPGSGPKPAGTGRAGGATIRSRSPIAGPPTKATSEGFNHPMTLIDCGSGVHPNLTSGPPFQDRQFRDPIRFD